MDRRQERASFKLPGGAEGELAEPRADDDASEEEDDPLLEYGISQGDANQY